MKKPIESLRESITIPEGVTYLNWASQGIIPNAALDASLAILRLRGRTDVDIVQREFSATDRARELAAGLLDASADEICLTPNTSVGVNLAAQAIGFEPGDEVLLLREEFPTNLVPWLNLEKKGSKVRYLQVSHKYITPEEIEAQIGPKTRAIAISFVQFYDGYRHDLKAIGAVCRKRGVYLAVDAMQGLGACPLSVKEMPVDFVSCGATKWLASPYGTGFCYIRRELVHRIDWLPSHGWLAHDYSKGEFSSIIGNLPGLYGGARKFEVGTLPYHDWAAFNVAVELLLGVGVETIYSHVARLYQRLVDGLATISSVTITSCLEAPRRSGILSFRVPDTAALCDFLMQENVFVSHREGSIRVSIHGFNNEGDIDNLLAATEEFAGSHK